MLVGLFIRVVVIALAQLLLFAGNGQAVSLAQGQDWAYLGRDDQGQVVCARQYHGRVVLVNFWASWCTSCLQELRILDDLQRRYPRQVVVIAVNAAEDDQTIAQFKDRLGAQQLTFTRGAEPALSAAGITGVPQTLVLDQQGRVRFRHMGYSAGMARTLADEVDSLVSGQNLLKESLPPDEVPAN